MPTSTGVGCIVHCINVYVMTFPSCTIFVFVHNILLLSSLLIYNWELGKIIYSIKKNRINILVI